MQIPIPHYCERTAEGIFNEPLNAITNVAFIISAFFVYQLLRKQKVKNRKLYLVSVIIGMIGIGSTSWHTLRLPITLIFDSVPIYLFILVILYFLLRSFIKSSLNAFILVLSYIGLQIVIWLSLSPSLFNNAIRHIINLIVFSILLVFLKKKFVKLPKALGITFIFYAAAIIFKMIDLQVCKALPLGTHFLWHVFNAIATYYAVRLVVELDYESKNIRTNR